MAASVNKATEGATEVWGYTSGNGMTSVASSRFCNINIVMASGHVTAVNYTGPTEGMLTVGEQCAYAVDACVRQR
jgi:hypothetical protein